MKLRLGITLVALTVAAVGCSDDDDDLIAPVLGDLEIVTVTSGDDIDADGYTITIDGVDGPAIGANASVTEAGIPAGPFLIGLDNIALNCQTQDNPRTVNVVGGQTVTTQFDVVCVAPNEPPVADAGMDQTVVDADDSGSEDVVLDGSASMDPDGPLATWSWSEDSVEIATGETPTVTFAVGVHTVTLTVTDEDGATDTDDVMITVEAAPAPVSFATQIQPYFEAGMANCVQCHSPGTGFGGVNLDSYANIMVGGDNGPLVVAGDSQDATALLVPKLNADHNNGPDDAGFVVTLSQWIDEGALDN